MRLSAHGSTGPHWVDSAPRCPGHAGGMTGPMCPHPTSHKIRCLGGRVGERAEKPKVPAMRSVVGMAAEGGAAIETRPSASFAKTLSSLTFGN